MATLNLTSSEFADIALIWLFDQAMNPDQVKNERFKDFLDKNSPKLKAPLIKYYLDTDSDKRLMYKRIKGVFEGDNAIQQIRIGPDGEIDKVKSEKEGIMKKIIKKVLLKQSLSIEDENMLKELRDEIEDELNEEDYERGKTVKDNVKDNIRRKEIEDEIGGGE